MSVTPDLRAGACAPLATGEVLFTVSIDTEEDNWIPARHGIRVENSRQLPRVNAFLERLGLRPTYFVTHAVVADSNASLIIRELHDSQFVEIGAHLHPWNTPPMDEPFVPRNTMLLNITESLQRAKLEQLTRSFQTSLDGWRPRAFRAGRWGLGSSTLNALIDCGYTVDSSVTPQTTWSEYDDGPSHVGAPIYPYSLGRDSDVRCPTEGPLIEVPVSFGFNRAPQARWGRVYRALKSAPARALLLDQLVSWAGFLRHITLSPETDSVDDMLAFTRALLAEGVPHLHLYFHSPSLSPGLAPYVRTAQDLDRFYGAIEEYVQRVAGIIRLRPATVSEVASLAQSSADLGPEATPR